MTQLHTKSSKLTLQLNNILKRVWMINASATVPYRHHTDQH